MSFQVGAIQNSTEQRVGVLKNARVNEGSIWIFLFSVITCLLLFLFIYFLTKRKQFICTKRAIFPWYINLEKKKYFVLLDKFHRPRLEVSKKLKRIFCKKKVSFSAADMIRIIFSLVSFTANCLVSYLFLLRLCFCGRHSKQYNWYHQYQNIKHVDLCDASLCGRLFKLPNLSNLTCSKKKKNNAIHNACGPVKPYENFFIIIGLNLPITES